MNDSIQFGELDIFLSIDHSDLCVRRALTRLYHRSRL
jgi:hypothetical protein